MIHQEVYAGIENILLPSLGTTVQVVCNVSFLKNCWLITQSTEQDKVNPRY